MRFALTLALTACAPTISFDLDQPLALTVDPVLAAQPLADVAEFRAEFDGVARQLGTHVVDAAATTNPVVNLVYSADCGGQGELVTSFVEGESADRPSRTSSTIHLCFAFLDRRYLWPEILAHELGHVLGAPHLPCDGKNVMCAVAPQNVPDYSADDLAAICVHSTGGVCGKAEAR